MYLQTLKNISYKNSLKKADIACLTGVSRATVTKWFRRVKEDGSVNVESETLKRLAAGLGVPIERLLKPLPDLAPYRTEFLWDGLYPSMEGFVQALIQGRLPALARLVQEVGFAKARRVIGKRIITQFPQYKKLIKPVRRQPLEILWPLYASQK